MSITTLRKITKVSGTLARKTLSREVSLGSALIESRLQNIVISASTTSQAQEQAIDSFQKAESLAKVESEAIEIVEANSPAHSVAGQVGARELRVPQQELTGIRVPRIFNVTQKWQGEVLSVDAANEEFVAQIKDLEDPARSDENVTFSF